MRLQRFLLIFLLFAIGTLPTGCISIKKSKFHTGGNVQSTKARKISAEEEHAIMEQTNKMFAIGLAAEQQNDLQAAEWAYLKCLQFNEDKKSVRYVGPPYHRLAVIAARQGKTEKSETYFRKALEFGTENQELACDFAQMLIDDGREHEAATILENALITFPKDKKLLFFLGHTLAIQNREIEALRRLKGSIGEAAAYHELAQILRDKGNPRGADLMDEKGRLAQQDNRRKPLDDWKDNLNQDLLDERQDSSMVLLDYLSQTPKLGNINRRYREAHDNQSDSYSASPEQMTSTSEVNPTEVLMKYGRPEFTEPLPQSPVPTTVQPKFADINPNMVPVPIPHSSIAARPQVQTQVQVQTQAQNESPLPPAPPVPQNQRFAVKPSRNIVFPPEMVIPQEDEANAILIADTNQLGKPATITTSDLELPSAATVLQSTPQAAPQTSVQIASASPSTSPAQTQTKPEPETETEMVLLVLESPKNAVSEIPSESQRLAMRELPTRTETTPDKPAEMPKENVQVAPVMDQTNITRVPSMLENDFLTPDLPVMQTLEPAFEKTEVPAVSTPQTEVRSSPNLNLEESQSLIEKTSPMEAPRIAAAPERMAVAAPSSRPAQIAVVPPVKQEGKHEESAPMVSTLIAETPTIPTVAAQPAQAQAPPVVAQETVVQETVAPGKAATLLVESKIVPKKETKTVFPPIAAPVEKTKDLKVESKKQVTPPQSPRTQRQVVRQPVQVNPSAAEKPKEERKSEMTDNSDSIQLPVPQLDLLAKFYGNSQSSQRTAHQGIGVKDAGVKNEIPVIPPTARNVEVPAKAPPAKPSVRIVANESTETGAGKALSFGETSDLSASQSKPSKTGPSASIKESTSAVPSQTKSADSGKKSNTKIKAVQETKPSLRIVEKKADSSKEKASVVETTVLKLGTDDESEAVSKDDDKTIAFSGEIVPLKINHPQKLTKSSSDAVSKLEKKTVTETTPKKLLQTEPELNFIDESEQKTLSRSVSLHSPTPQTARSNNLNQKELTLKL